MRSILHHILLVYQKTCILFGTKELVFCSMKIVASKILLSWVETKKKDIGAKLNFDIAI